MVCDINHRVTLPSMDGASHITPAELIDLEIIYSRRGRFATLTASRRVGRAKIAEGSRDSIDAYLGTSAVVAKSDHGQNA